MAALADHRVIKDETLNILLAGRDTTSCTLTFAVYALAQHPRVLARLRAEGLGKGEVVWMELDLEQPKRIAEYVAKFTEKETRLDILSESATFLHVPGK